MFRRRPPAPSTAGELDEPKAAVTGRTPSFITRHPSVAHPRKARRRRPSTLRSSGSTPSKGRWLQPASSWSKSSTACWKSSPRSAGSPVLIFLTRPARTISPTSAFGVSSASRPAGRRYDTACVCPLHPDDGAAIHSLAGVRSSLVYGWLRGRLPNRIHMALIYRVTRGEVAPNGFYALPRVRRVKGRPQPEE
jgi:hypothetical protein